MMFRGLLFQGASLGTRLSGEMEQWQLWIWHALGNKGKPSFINSATNNQREKQINMVIRFRWIAALSSYKLTLGPI